jgi:ligand-binding sensor domain-containing protein
MLAAGDGTIWIGTRRGISHWDGKGWQAWEHLGYPDPDGLVVHRLYETNDGNIWAATSEDFARWDGQEWTTYQRSPACFTVFTLLETDDGSLWAGCSGGLFRWTGSIWVEYGEPEGVSDNSYSRLIQGTNAILYAATKSGTYQYVPDLDRWQPFPSR